MVQEGATAASADRVYVHGGRIDEIVASQVNGTWYNHHYDAQGNCILLSTGSGGIQEQYDYDAFGFPYFYTASGGNPGDVKTRFLFTGREWLKDLRIYDFRNRQYQPELGRFLQPDPKEFEASDYNLYRYCHNDPVNNSDPTGFEFLATSERVQELKNRDLFGKTMVNDKETKITIEPVKGKANTYRVVGRLLIRAHTQVATHHYGQARSESAIKATEKLHEPKHVGAYKAVHDSFQKQLPSGPINRLGPATEAARAMIKALGGALKHTEDVENQHLPRSQWAPIEAAERQ